MGGIVLLGLLVRIPRLGESLWYDEIAAWREMGQYSPFVIIGNLYDPANHILHTLLTHWSVAWFGDSALSLRLPAFIFSLLAIPSTFALCHRFTTNRCAIIAAALMALMPIAVLEGVEARGYSMMIFFSALISWLWLKGRAEGHTWVWVAYAGACALGIWAHLMTVCVPLGHGFILFAQIIGTRSIRPHLQPGIALILAAVFTLTLYAPVLPDLLHLQPAISGSGSTLLAIIGSEGGHLLLSLGGGWSWWATPGIMLTLWGAWIIARNPQQKQLLGLTFLGLLFLIIAVLAGKSWLYARFALFILPGIALLQARGIEKLWVRKKILGLGVALLILGTWTSDLLLRPPKQPLREVANFVAEQRKKSDPQPVMVLGLFHGVMDAYGAAFPRIPGSSHPDSLAIDLDRHHPKWIIMLYPRSISPASHALLYDQGYGLARSFPGWADWGNGEIRVFQRTSESEVNAP